MSVDSLSPTAKRDRFMDQLVSLGYGRSRAEVADYLVQRGLDDLLRAGVIKPVSARTVGPTPVRPSAGTAS